LEIVWCFKTKFGYLLSETQTKVKTIMEATRLNDKTKEAVKNDMVLLGRICEALDKSIHTVLYRWLPEDNEQLTLPKIQAIIKSHLGLPEDEIIIEEVTKAA
jgi:hypothetical protein